jgi:hypothetical protein
MVDLEVQECKIDNNILAFEKGKVYCVKVHIYAYPKEYIQMFCEHLVEIFKRRDIEIIAIPIIDEQMDLEFFKVNEKEKNKN